MKSSYHKTIDIFSWETDFEVFPTYSDVQKTSDEYIANSDQQDAIITMELDLRSCRQDANTDTAATEQREHERHEVDLRSARRQQNTN